MAHTKRASKTTSSKFLPERHAWSEAFTARYESAFSRLQKFAWLNAIDGQTMLRQWFPRRSNALFERHDLLCGSWLRSVVRIPDVLRLSDGFVTSVGSYWPPKFASGTYLRYCPRCLAQGYHSFFHQFDAVIRCPIHGETLLTRCSCCDSETPPLILDAASFRRPFLCGSCERPLAGLLDPRRWSGRIRSEAEVGMGPFGAWVRELQRMAPRARDSCAGYLPLESLGLLTADPEAWNRVAWFALASMVVTPCPLPPDHVLHHGLPLVAQRLILNSARRHAFRRSKSPPGSFEAYLMDGMEIADRLRCVLKSIARYLRRRYLRRHRGCLAASIFNVKSHPAWFGGPVQVDHTPGFCSLAISYRRWWLLQVQRGWAGPRLGADAREIRYNVVAIAQYAEHDPGFVRAAHAALAEFYDCVALVMAYNAEQGAVDVTRCRHEEGPGPRELSPHLAVSCQQRTDLPRGCFSAENPDWKDEVLLIRGAAAVVPEHWQQHGPTPQRAGLEIRRRRKDLRAQASPPAQERWLPQWVSPHESAWCLVLKYAIANARRADELIPLLRSRSDHPLDLVTGYGLRKPFPLIAPGEAIVAGTLRAYAPRWRNGLAVERKHLRYCPACITHVYHSSWQQIWAIENCPVHEAELTIRCVHCNSLMPPPELSDAWIKREFNCKKCRRPLGTRKVGEPARWVAPSGFGEQIREVFDWVATYLRKCEQTHMNV